MENNKSKENEKSIKDNPPQKELVPPEQLISFEVFCSTVGNDSFHKFADVRIKTYCRNNNIELNPKTFSEWENIYNKIQNS